MQIFIASAHSFVFPLGLMSGVTTARAPGSELRKLAKVMHPRSRFDLLPLKLV